MIDLSSNELSHFGISLLSNNRILLIDSGSTVSLDEFCTMTENRCEQVLDIKKEIALQLNDVTSNSVRDFKKGLIRPSLSSLKYFLKEVSSIDGYNSVFQKKITSILNGCGFSFSMFSRKNIILYKMISRWLDYLIKRDLYIYQLIINTIEQSVSEIDHEKVARGIQGPWGNLDIPMQERVFKWDDVAEETYGRRADIQKQRRYVMGLEDYHDPNVKVGYYFRELRNEPYLFSDADTESPYPHRNLLWSS